MEEILHKIENGNLKTCREIVSVIANLKINPFSSEELLLISDRISDRIKTLIGVGK